MAIQFAARFTNQSFSIGYLFRIVILLSNILAAIQNIDSEIRNPAVH